MLSQGVFGLLWHMMTRNSNNEVVFNILFAVALYVSIVAVRLVERKILETMRAMGRNTRSVIFIGSDPANLFVYNDIMMDATTGYRVQGYYSNDTIEDAPK
jgi:putative colanic acid biosynthesis UDP-glucose lipid carrier transferase